MKRSRIRPSLALAIGRPLQVLAELAGQAVEAIGEAQVLQAEGRQSEAMNALLNLDGRLEEAITLHKAIEILHRHR